jgi:uncharacterized protein YlzI (FlbEa/FlbD family)
MAFNINEIKSQMLFDGARPSLFQVTLQNPANSVADVKLPFMCEATALPAANLGEVQVPYFGRVIKLAGTRTYDDWTVTIINDEDFLVRNALEEWSNRLNTFQGNIRAFSSASPLLYKSQAQVVQYSKTGVPIRTYQFNGIFPKAIAEVALNWADGNAIERFQVTFAVDYWEVSGGVTGNAGGV